MSKNVESEELQDYIVGVLETLDFNDQHFVSCKKLSYISTIMMTQNKSNPTGDDYIIAGRIRKMFITTPVNQMPKDADAGLIEGVDSLTKSKHDLFAETRYTNC